MTALALTAHTVFSGAPLDVYITHSQKPTCSIKMHWLYSCWKLTMCRVLCPRASWSAGWRPLLVPWTESWRDINYATGKDWGEPTLSRSRPRSSFSSLMVLPTGSPFIFYYSTGGNTLQW